MKNTTIAALITGVLAAPLGHSAEPTLGAELFAAHCAGCHGADGEGGGPLAIATQTTVPNLRTLQMRNGGVFPADAITAYIDGRTLPSAHGMRQMPVWGDVFLSEEGVDKKIARGRIAALVGFIAELQHR